ncbi:MAG: hypothetical protein C0417_03795 [Chlorobiaceae bacterium]|nr:hypothetical protein [Chlorobiaceae bacterium]
MRFLFFIFLSILITINICNAQGEAAALFLLISPTTEANGMGEASIAIPMNDPLTALRNPAQLGFQSANNYFSYSTNASDWLPNFNIPDLRYRTDGFTSGVNFQNIFGNGHNLSFGYGYFHTLLNLGELSRRGENNEDLGTFYENEYANQWTVSIAIDYVVKFSVGLSHKSISSNLITSGIKTGFGKARDYGLLLDVPLIEITNAILSNPIKIHPNIYPSANISLGAVWQNIGDDFQYPILSPDPLPRMGRVGIGTNLSFDYRKNDFAIQLVSFKWTVEASDMLIDRWGDVRDQAGNLIKAAGWSYRGGMGDIKFFDEVILGHSNYRTERRRGWELSIAEILSVRYGRLTDRMGNRHVTTNGIGIQSKGLFQIIKLIVPNTEWKTIPNFLLSHLNFRYDQSTWSTVETDHPLNNTKFEGFSMAIHN